MGILSKLKETFLPSEEVAAARREKVFGTESKVAPAVVIPVAAAAAIAIGPVALAGAAAKVGTQVKESIAAASLGTKVALTAGTIVATGAAVQNPKIIKEAASAPADLYNFGGNIGKISKDPSKENILNTFQENPIISGAALVAAGASAAGAVYYGVSTVEKLSSSAANASPDLIKEVEKEYQEKMKTLGTNTEIPEISKELVPESKAKDVVSSNVPLTPQTQVLGKTVSSSTKKPSRNKLSHMSPFSLRVNINNNIMNTKYLNARHY